MILNKAFDFHASESKACGSFLVEIKHQISYTTFLLTGCKLFFAYTE